MSGADTTVIVWCGKLKRLHENKSIAAQHRAVTEKRNENATRARETENCYNGKMMMGNEPNNNHTVLLDVYL